MIDERVTEDDVVEMMKTPVFRAFVRQLEDDREKLYDDLDNFPQDRDTDCYVKGQISAYRRILFDISERIKRK